MIFMIIIPIIVLVWTLVYFFREGEYDFGIVSGILLPILAFLLTGMIIVLPLSAAAKSLQVPIVYEDTTTQIIALQDGNLTDGRIPFLGSGYVKDELKYTYMYDTEKGYTVNQVPAKHSYIQYSQHDPYVIQHSAVKFDDAFWNLIAFPSVDTEYYFYIPEGSIVQGYNIDLQ